MVSKLEMNLATREVIGDGLRRSALRYPDKTAIICYKTDGSSTSYTFQELNQKTNQVANNLLEMGLKKGDKVAMLSSNCIEFVILGYALMKIGVWYAPVNFMLGPKEVESLINFAEAKMFFVQAPFIDIVLPIKDKIPTVERFGYIGAGGKTAPEGWLDFKDLIKGSTLEPEVLIQTEDVATLFFTSGTESAPKGVLTTHNNYYASHMTYLIGFKLTSDDSFLLSLPMIHMAGYNLMLMGITVSLTQVMTEIPDPALMAELIPKHKITGTALPPTLYVILLGVPALAEADLSHATKFITWASTIPKAMIEGWTKIAPNVSFFTIQGSSESTATAITGGWFKSWEEIPNQDGRWVGHPMSYGCELKLVDENDQEVPVGEPGEQLIRGSVVLKEYYKNDAVNEVAFRGGWLHTGDVLFRDENNNYFFADRKKDMIKTGGENVFCQEVESVIGTNSEVMQCAVFGLPDDRWGEAVTAVVVARQGSNVTEGDIIGFCKDNLPGFKVPKKVFFRGSLPTSAANKILKRDLKDEYSN